VVCKSEKNEVDEWQIERQTSRMQGFKVAIEGFRDILQGTRWFGMRMRDVLMGSSRPILA
jgi:hypothetical protein